MRFDLWLADACRTADVSYDDLILTGRYYAELYGGQIGDPNGSIPKWK